LALYNGIGKVVFEKVNLLRGTGLRARCARGSIILGAATFAERALRLIRNMILARILAPEDFGLMAIVLASSTIFEAFGDVGVRQSVIHSEGGGQSEYLNMAWWFQGVRGLGIYTVGFLLAPFVGSFYGNPELTLFLRIALVTVVFSGLASPGVHILEKELRFGRLVFVRQGGAALGTVIAILLAVWIRNVWALVIGFTTETIAYCLFSFIACPFWPKFRIDKNSIEDLLKYARGMLGLSLLIIVSMQTDIFVLSKLMSSGQVGMYALALALAQQPIAMFSKIMGSVLLPAFAEKQWQRDTLCREMLKMIRSTVLIGVPLIGLAVILAGPILSVIYGQRFVAVAIPFSILCVSVLFRIQKTILGTMYLALGKPNLHRRFVLIMVTVIIIAMYPAVKLFGLAGAAGVLLFADVIGLSMHVIGMPQLIGLRLRDYISCWLPCAWLVPVILWPILILGPMGATSEKTKTGLIILGLFISYLIYFRPRFCREKTSHVS
jgi:O-antigen/teichoic acid export membrane protein